MKKLTKTYTIVNSLLGSLLLAGTEKGLCCVQFGANKKKLEVELKKEFNAEKMISTGGRNFQKWTGAVLDYLAGRKPWPKLPYDVRATAFQKKVWNWLQTVPTGKTYSYSEAAKAIGSPKAARGVARACATNQVALVIPCHRIVPKSGGEGGYRWGSERKCRLLDLEKEGVKK